jgi:hypothetical protein
LEEISDELLATDGRGIDARLKEIEAFVLSELQNNQGRLAGEIPRAKAELAKHCTEITLTPEGNSDRLSGEWDLLGDVRSDGAGARIAPWGPSLESRCELAASVFSGVPGPVARTPRNQSRCTRWPYLPHDLPASVT